MSFWFKNLLVYRLESEWTLSPGGLEAELARHPLQACSALSLQSNGWVNATPEGAMVGNTDHHLLIALGIEKKLLPGSVVKSLTEDKVAEFERSRGFKPGRKAIAQLKEQATTELLPRAFVQRRAMRAWIDPDGRRLIVDSASATRAEILVEELRRALVELPVSLPQTESSPAVRFTEWLSSGRAPAPFSLEDECELTGSDASKPVVRYVRHPLEPDKLRRHFDAGMRTTRLALSWNGRLSFVIDEKFQIKRLRYLDIQEDSDAAAGANVPFEAEFALMASEVGAMLADLEVALGWAPARTL